MDAIKVGQSSIDRSLRILSKSIPTPTKRAKTALGILLEGIIHSPWQEVAWNFSRLTGDGFPVEFCFSSENNFLRYTTEIAGPEVAAKEKLFLAEKKMERLGAKPIPKKTKQAFQKIQRTGSLEFGAWIGGCHNFKSDLHKLYLEVPENCLSVACELLGESFATVHFLPGDATKLRMIGYEPDTSNIELYFRTSRVEAWKFEHIMRNLGLESKIKSLFGLIEETYGRYLEEPLPATGQGFSIKFSQKKTTAFSLFFFARSIFGSDRSIRRKLLLLGGQKGWNLQNYKILSKPLINRANWKTYHGIVSFSVTHKGPPVLQFGLRPP